MNRSSRTATAVLLALLMAFANIGVAAAHEQKTNSTTHFGQWCVWASGVEISHGVNNAGFSKSTTISYQLNNPQNGDNAQTCTAVFMRPFDNIRTTLALMRMNGNTPESCMPAGTSSNTNNAYALTRNVYYQQDGAHSWGKCGLSYYRTNSLNQVRNGAWCTCAWVLSPSHWLPAS